ncbi:MAG: TRAP transporter small permease subunit [Acidobacteria bacterium]|nr:TRAP transporter small permease subunit [Acidobacteriota bacterium]
MRLSIDTCTEKIGRTTSWLTLAMVLFGAFNAIARYLGRSLGMHLSSNLYIELQWYLFSAIFLLGGAYTLKMDEHVRVDVIYSRFSERTKMWLDLVGTLAFLMPFCVLMIWVTVPAAYASWAEWEQSNDPGGLPRYPIKTLVPLAFVLLILQGFSNVLKLIRKLRDKDA